MTEKNQKLNIEEKSKNFLNSPYLQSISFALLLITASMSILYVQYNQVESLTDSARSQISIIENEYKRFTNVKNSYNVIVEDVTNNILAKKLEINDFERLYIRSILRDVKLLSSSNVFKGESMGDISIFISILTKHFEELKILYKRTKDSNNSLDKNLSNKILHYLFKISAQKTIMYNIVNKNKENYDKLEIMQYISTSKLDLMNKTLSFSGVNSKFNDRTLNKTCILLLSSYSNKGKIAGKYYFKNLIKTSFQFLLIKGIMTEKEIEIFDFQNIFGNNITKTQQSNLKNILNSLFELDTIKKRIEYYNDTIIKSWYMNLDSPSINLTKIEMRDVTYK